MIKMYLTGKYGLLAGNYNEPDIHSHYFLHMIVSLDGTFQACFGLENGVETEGIVIDSNIPHTLAYEGTILLVYLIEATTDIAESIKQNYLSQQSYAQMSKELIAYIRSEWQAFQLQTAGRKEPMPEFKQFSRKIFEVCGLEDFTGRITDGRIVRALALIDRWEGIYENAVGALARDAGLSVSRFSHLFKAQTGISLRSYLAHQKAGKAYEYGMDGMSMTDAAVKAGFASLSHFNDTHRRMFGIAISNVIKIAEIYTDSFYSEA